MPSRPKTSQTKFSSSQKVLLLLAVVLVSIGVSITYYYFEAAVRHSTTYIWDTLLDTETRRALVIPICIVLSLAFFGIQHYLDPASETHESEGLGQAPTPSVVNFSKVIFIGFMSLLAGASLGPEAILVPACLIIGGYAGVRLFNNDKKAVGLLSMVGFIALFAAFFNSFIAGMIGLLLVTKQVKVKLNIPLVIIAALASGITVWALSILESSAYTKLPPTAWHITLDGTIAIMVLLVGGYAVTYAMSSAHKIFEIVHRAAAASSWWLRGLVASVGLSILYLLGGPLVEFTGNESIQPMLKQSVSLGFVGLAWILVVKILAISWSKAQGYRGGMVFPSIFVASTLVAIVQIFAKDLGFTAGLVAVMVGLIVANTKVKILF